MAIVVTHPIQYYAPVFREMARIHSVEVRVFYTWSQSESGEVQDSGFERAIAWNVPLLDGYAFEFVPNESDAPSLEAYSGIRNPSLLKRISDWAADAVLVFGWNHHSHMAALRHFHGKVPTLFRGDSTLLDPRPPLKNLARRAVLTWIYRHVDLAFAVGTNSREYFRWAGVPEHRVLVIPHSIDSLRFSSQNDRHEESAMRTRRALGIDDDVVAFLFSGKLQQKKNPGLLLDAFIESAAQSHLVIVGDGPLEQDLKRRAGDSRRIHFLPFQNQAEMPAIYRIGDVFVLPSSGPGETWGLAMNEALASGRLVVGSSMAGGTVDLIHEGESGWRFASGDNRQLKSLLIQAEVLGRKELLAMGARAQADAVEWSSERTAERIGEAVLSLLENKTLTR